MSLHTHLRHDAQGSDPDPARSSQPADHPRHAAGRATHLRLRRKPGHQAHSRSASTTATATQTSQDLLKHFQATDYFYDRACRKQLPTTSSADRPESAAGGHRGAAAILRRPSNPMARRSVQALLDASDSNTASIGMGYAQASCRAIPPGPQIESAWAQRHGRPRGPQTSPSSRAPGSMKTWKACPTLCPAWWRMVMAVVGAFLTSLTIAREWERGTMEQLISTPVGKLEIQIGKLVPYFVIGMTDTALCAGAAVWWFGVPFRGSWTVMFACSMLFLIVVLSWAICISVTAKSQLAASQMALLATFLPTFLLSGFIFPINRCRRCAVDHAVLPARYLRFHPAQRIPERYCSASTGRGHLRPCGDRDCLVVLATRSFQKRLE